MEIITNLTQTILIQIVIIQIIIIMSQTMKILITDLPQTRVRQLLNLLQQQRRRDERLNQRQEQQLQEDPKLTRRDHRALPTLLIQDMEI